MSVCGSGLTNGGALRRKIQARFDAIVREGQMTSGKYDDTPVQLDHAHDCLWGMLQSSDDDIKLTAAYAAKLEELTDLDVEYEEVWKPRFTDLQLEQSSSETGGSCSPTYTQSAIDSWDRWSFGRSLESARDAHRK
jgi:hypothetical protein